VCGVTATTAREWRGRFAFRKLRRYRETNDGFLAWGHNSRWKTDFPRDCLTADSFHFKCPRCGRRRRGTPRMTSQVERYDATAT
jgi:hypothetical protein